MLKHDQAAVLPKWGSGVRSLQFEFISLYDGLKLVSIKWLHTCHMMFGDSLVMSQLLAFASLFFVD